MSGMALSQTDSKAKTVPRSSLGINLDVIDRKAGATMGLQIMELK